MFRIMRLSPRWVIPLFWVVLFLPFPVLGSDLAVHYHRPDGDYDGWTLWTWNPDAELSKDVSPSGRDAFGAVFQLQLENYGAAARVGLLPKYKSWESKDDPDRFWTADLGNDVFIVSSDKTLYTKKPDVSSRVLKALLDSADRIRVVLSKSAQESDLDAARFTVKDGTGRIIPATSAKAVSRVGDGVKSVDLTLESPFPPDSLAGASVSFGDYRPGPILPGKILDQPAFFSDAALGAFYAPERTTFRVFAPTALTVTVNLYDQPVGGEPARHSLQKKPRGIWEGEVSGDQLNRYYTVRATFSDAEYEVMDPYAKSTTAHNGRAVIFRDATPLVPPPSFDPKDAVIYEMHIRDFTIDPKAGLRPDWRGKYMGLTQEGTRYEDDESILTALDHLKELGVNVVQIMPIHDFDNDESKDEYNWGYMPFHFFSPEGMFATRRDDASRVRETKKMINALHRSGMKVVLDVVYNHTAEGSPAVRVSFNGLCPNYYYRLRDDGGYWNGSGCGNEFRSESPMGRKLMLDSMKYWVTEYGIDGFRFDLMGLIDLETLKAVVREIRAIKPDALIYGEPWAGGSTGIRVTSKGDQKGVGFFVFNDHFRDAIKGGTFNKDPGFIQDGRDIAKIKKGIRGSIDDFAKDPVESINYAEAHDNHTLWDRLEFSTAAMSGVDRDARVRMDKLAAAIVLTSQGIPFLHSGQELLRTKGGEDNTYNKPDAINQIHWRWKRENKEVFEYYKGLIRMRREHPMFRLGTAEDVKKNLFFLDDHLGLSLPPKTVGFVLHRGNTNDAWATALVLFNANGSAVDFKVPASRWTPADVSSDALGGFSGREAMDAVRVPARSAAIFFNTDNAFYETVLKPRSAPQGQKKTRFSVSAPGASRVTMAGSFNNWNMEALALERQADGTWATELELGAGTYEYKFLADGDWNKLNPDNRKITVSSGTGGSAGVLGPKKTRFSVSAPGASRVTLAGSFNDWNMEALALDRQPDGTWATELELKSGAYEYKFLADGDWNKLNPDNRKITVP